MALYIPHSIFHLGRLLYVRPETFGPYYIHPLHEVRTAINENVLWLIVSLTQHLIFHTKEELRV